jgi:lactoylglutathione lyase
MMKFLHTMVRIHDLEKSLEFYINHLGLIETKRVDVPKGKFSLIFLKKTIRVVEILAI